MSSMKFLKAIFLILLCLVFLEAGFYIGTKFNNFNRIQKDMYISDIIPTVTPKIDYPSLVIKERQKVNFATNSASLDLSGNHFLYYATNTLPAVATQSSVVQTFDVSVSYIGKITKIDLNGKYEKFDNLYIIDIEDPVTKYQFNAFWAPKTVKINIFHKKVGTEELVPVGFEDLHIGDLVEIHFRYDFIDNSFKDIIIVLLEKNT